MPWLADTDVGAAQGFARALLEARTVADVRRGALSGFAKLVPADVLTWDRVELGIVDRQPTLAARIDVCKCAVGKLRALLRAEPWHAPHDRKKRRPQTATDALAARQPKPNACYPVHYERDAA